MRCSGDRLSTDQMVLISGDLGSSSLSGFWGYFLWKQILSKIGRIFEASLSVMMTRKKRMLTKPRWWRWWWLMWREAPCRSRRPCTGSPACLAPVQTRSHMCKTWCKHSTKHCTNIVQNIVQNIVAGDMVIQLTSLVLCISVIIARDIKLTSLVIYHISYSHITRDKLRYTTDLSCVADLVTDNQIECLFLEHGLHKI